MKNNNSSKKINCKYNICTSDIFYNITDKLYNCNIHPNFITGINLFIIFPIIIYLLFKTKKTKKTKNNVLCEYLLLIFISFIRGVLDNLDGYTARKCNTASKFGEYFDSITDKIFIFSMYFIIIKTLIKQPMNLFKVSIISIIILCFIYGIKHFFNNNFEDKSYSLHYFTMDNIEIINIILVCFVKYTINNF